MNNLDAAALLLDRGASVHIVTDSGRAPLYQAAYVRIIVSFSLVLRRLTGVPARKRAVRDAHTRSQAQSECCG